MLCQNFSGFFERLLAVKAADSDAQRTHGQPPEQPSNNRPEKLQSENGFRTCWGLKKPSSYYPSRSRDTQFFRTICSAMDHKTVAIVLPGIWR